MSCYTINESSNILNTTNSYNTVSNYYTAADDRSQLLTWLSPLEPSLHHRDIRERRVNDVGEWLIRSEEFRRWYRLSGDGGGDSPVLFCWGDPGVGKTFISSLVVDRLCEQARGQDTAVTCFYFDFAAREEQSATGMLGSLVKQAVSGMEKIPEEIWRAFQEQKKAIGGCGPQLAELVHMLQFITSSQPTFVCIDALDECVGVQRARVLDSLKKVLDRSPRVRIFMTGRPHIRAEIENRLPGRTTSISVRPERGDITEYLRVRLAEDETPDAMNASLEAEILEKIPKSISEMFLLVSLNIDSILQESTIYRRRERLRKITDGVDLGDAYQATIERIRAQGGGKSRLGMEALMWICHAERPLTADELCHALAIELGSTDFNADNIPSISTLVSCCQGLVTLDKEASTVRLIHFTLKEYLSAHPDIFSSPHSAMTEICLTYLNSEHIKALCVDPSPRTLDTPFLGYCSRFWGVHAKREPSCHTRSLALNMLREYDGHISAKSLLSQTIYMSPKDSETDSRFSGLHCASYFGIAEIVAALIDMGHYDINKSDVWGYTPLAWASKNGHEEVVEILLAREGVNPDKADNDGRTPLLWAAANGHGEVVRILLACEEVNPDKAGNDGGTPLLWAAGGGHGEAVKILLACEEVNPDQADNYGWTPLIMAAEGGHGEVVKVLLAREGVNPNKADNSGRTPLRCAARGGHGEVVKILITRGEGNPEKPDNYGRTPLCCAAVGGHGELVKFLLEREDMDPDKEDNDGRTPLWHAAAEGHGEVVKILLACEKVNGDKPDPHGTTPLSVAAEEGHEDVVKILLEREEVNRENKDGDGDTPLACAALDGREGVVKILLQQQGVNPDEPNHAGRTPLSQAAANGHDGVVQILLEQEEVNPNEPDNDGQTPLMHATKNCHQRVIELLEPRKMVAHYTLPGTPDTTS